MMKVKVRYAKLLSFGRFNNHQAEATIEVEEGETAQDAFKEAKILVDEALAEPKAPLFLPLSDDDWEPDVDEDDEEEEDDEEADEEEDLEVDPDDTPKEAL